MWDGYAESSNLERSVVGLAMQAGSRKSLFAASVAAQDVVEGECALQGSAAGAVEDGEQRPAREKVEGGVEGHVGEEQGCAVGLEGTLDGGFRGEGSGGAG